MVHAEALRLVQRKKHASQEDLMFFLERQGEPVNDGAQNFKELRNAVEALCLVGELKEDVVDGAANEGS